MTLKKENAWNMQIVIKYADKKIDGYILEQFNKEVVSFGRQPDNDIILDLDFISRIHGVFFMEDGTWYVQDLDSTNGLLVNGTYIDQPYAIKEGDCICIQRKDGEESISIYISESEQAKLDKARSPKKLVIILSVICVLLAALIVSLIIYATHRDSSKKETATPTDASTETEETSEIEEPTTEAEEVTEELPDAEEDELNGGELEEDNYLKVKSEYYNPNDEYTGKWIYEYDSNYNLSSINSYTKDDQLESSLIYEYDSDGNITCEKSCTYYSGETEETDTIYIYENNKMVKYYDQKIGGEDVGYHVLEYGDSPYAIKETYYDSNGNTNSWNEYEYDENGNNIKEIYWVKDRKQGYRLCSETMKKYEKNQLIETEKNLYDKDGIIYENERQTNQYDEYGNVVENVIYKNGELFRSFKWQYIYNEFGLIETRSYYVDDMLSWVEKNEYSQK